MKPVRTIARVYIVFCLFGSSAPAFPAAGRTLAPGILDLRLKPAQDCRMQRQTRGFAHGSAS